MKKEQPKQLGLAGKPAVKYALRPTMADDPERAARFEKLTRQMQEQFGQFKNEN